MVHKWMEQLLESWRASSASELSLLEQVVRAWLIAPGPATLKPLEAELSAVNQGSPAAAIPLRWLSLFDDHSERRLNQKLTYLGLEDENGGFESGLLSRLHQLRATRLTRGPSDDESRPETGTEDSLFLQSVLQAIHPPRTPPAGHLLVNLESWELTPSGVGTERRMVSKPACLAFELFKTSESIAFSQFAESTLEVRQYDGWLHVHRIYNLLSRMRRQFSPWISIRTRNQRIYTITRWEKIGFVHPTPHEAIRASEPWKKLLQPPGERLPLSKLRASLPGPFTRSELERVAQVSRSSANRMLCQLKKRGHIRASGAGKNTDYAFLEPGHRIKVPITPAHS